MAMLAACTSTPQANRGSDQSAKEFATHPGYSTVYVYRQSTDNHFDDSVLYVDGRLIGTTLPGGYFLLNLQPGRHQLNGVGPDQGRMTLETRSDALHFVRLSLVGGYSHFEEIPEKSGRSELSRCCALLENWAPGQRPLLR